MKRDVREQAEAVFRVNPEEILKGSSVEIQELFHELNAHQVELQIQNEDLILNLSELETSRDAYAELYDTAPVGFFTFDWEGIIVRANSTLSEMLGVACGELVERRLFDFVARDWQDEWFRFHRALQHGAGNLGVELVVEPNGKTPIHVQLECTAHAGATARDWYCMGVVVDITDRWLAHLNRELDRRVEQRTAELRESEQRFSILFEEAPEACIVFDLTGCIHAVNQRAEELSGYDREELAEMNLFKSGVLETDSLHVVRESIKQLAWGQAVETTQISFHRKDGKSVPVEGSACPILWGGRSMACAMVRDITERLSREEESKKLHEELRRMSAELALAEERGRRRIAESLHEDVGQLLGSSLIRLKLLRDEALSDGVRDTIEAIIGTLETTLEKTRTLTFDLSCPLLNQLGLAASLDELCRSMSCGCGVLFKFLGGRSQSLPPLQMDRELMLYRAARELMTNVVKHAAARNASVELLLLDATVCLRIEDDGHGFDFAGGGQGFSPSGGFGLFSLQENVRHVGGRLEVESIPNDGTRVSISIPLGSEA